MICTSFKQVPGTADCEVHTDDGRAYIGSCTVWHDADTGKRCSTYKEGKLSEIWHMEMHRIHKAKFLAKGFRE